MVNQEIPCILFMPMVHYQVHNNLPLVPPSFSKVHYNIFPPMPKSIKSSFSFRFSNQNLVQIYFFPVYATSPVHFIHHDLITQIIFDEVY